VALAPESVYDVHGGHGLVVGVLGVCQRFTTTAASETADSGLGDALDAAKVMELAAMTLRAALAETLAPISSTPVHRFCLRCRFFARRSRFEAESRPFLFSLRVTHRDTYIRPCI